MIFRFKATEQRTFSGTVGSGSVLPLPMLACCFCCVAAPAQFEMLRSDWPPRLCVNGDHAKRPISFDVARINGEGYSICWLVGDVTKFISVVEPLLLIIEK